MQRNACKLRMWPLRVSAQSLRAFMFSIMRSRSGRVRTHRQFLFLHEVNDTSILKTARRARRPPRTDQRQLLRYTGRAANAAAKTADDPIRTSIGPGERNFMELESP
jgi:hypothetical protein